MYPATRSKNVHSRPCVVMLRIALIPSRDISVLGLGELDGDVLDRVLYTSIDELAIL